MLGAIQRVAFAGIASLLLTSLLGCGHGEVKPASKPFEISETSKRSRRQAVRATEYKAEKRELQVSDPRITPRNIESGGTVVQEVEYTVLSPGEDDLAPITQNVSISDGKDLTLELLNRTIEQKQGTYSSRMTVTLPRDLDPGAYLLLTVISYGELTKRVKGTFRLVEGKGGPR